MQGGKVSTARGLRHHFSLMPAGPWVLLLLDLPLLTLHVRWTYVHLKFRWICLLQQTLL